MKPLRFVQKPKFRKKKKVITLRKVFRSKLLLIHVIPVNCKLVGTSQTRTSEGMNNPADQQKNKIKVEYFLPLPEMHHLWARRSTMCSLRKTWNYSETTLNMNKEIWILKQSKKFQVVGSKNFGDHLFVSWLSFLTRNTLFKMCVSGPLSVGTVHTHFTNYSKA